MNRNNFFDSVARRAYRRMRNVGLHLRWRAFGWRHGLASTSPVNLITAEEKAQLDDKEEHFLKCLLDLKPKRFLEIGIGGYPTIERLRRLRDAGIEYTGCDFEEVCRTHQGALTTHGLNAEDFRYLSNKSGTYSWTLMDLMKTGEKFDVIYLDGHHTFYVDLPAAVLAHFLLTPKGYLFLDDIDWTLEFLKGNMTRFYADWALYRKAYDFSQYDEEQQRIPHIQMIGQKVMIEQFGYLKDPQRSREGWWVLRKPN